MKLLPLYFTFSILFSLVSTFTFAQESQIASPDAKLFRGENPWPDIRKKRISTLLPEALRAAKVDGWMVVARKTTMIRWQIMWVQKMRGEQQPSFFIMILKVSIL